MRFEHLALDGLVLARMDRREDGRGFFARSFCADEFAAAGLPTAYPQENVSFNSLRGVLRGLHWQDDPFQEGKLIRCTRGAVFDVAVDLRPHSAKRGRWLAVTLSEENGNALYIPPGFAHGFQALADRSELLYHMTVPFQPGLARGLRWDDPTLAIEWPLPEPILSERDSALPLFK